MGVMVRTSIFALSVAMLATPAKAQETAAPVEAQPAAAAAQADSDEGGLQDVVVTAQRRTETLQSAPLAVAVVSGEAITSAGVVNPAQLTTLVPSLQIANANGSYSNFYVRGVGNFTGNALTESAVAFNYDGVYVARPSSTVGFFYDLERIEVLKGPQGTLYGRNATGGAINVLPARPDFQLGGAFNAEYGNYDQIRIDGALNLPLSDNAAVRLSGIFARHDGYMQDGTDDQRDLGFRAQIRFRPTSELNILLAGDYFQSRGNGAGGTPVALGVDNRFGSFSPEAGVLRQATPHVLGGRFFDPLPNIQYQDNRYWGLNATRMVDQHGGAANHPIGQWRPGRTECPRSLSEQDADLARVPPRAVPGELLDRRCAGDLPVSRRAMVGGRLRQQSVR